MSTLYFIANLIGLYVLFAVVVACVEAVWEQFFADKWRNFTKADE